MGFDVFKLLHIPVAACETITIAFFFNRYLGPRHATKAPYITAFSLYFILNFIVSIFLTDALILLSLVGCFVISYTLYGSTRLQRGCCAGLLSAYFFVSEVSVLMISSFVLGYNVEEIAAATAAFYGGAFVSKAVTLLLAFVVTGVRKSNKYAISASQSLILLLTTYLCVGLSITSFITASRSGSPAPLFSVLSEFAIIILSVLGFFVFENFQRHTGKSAQGSRDSADEAFRRWGKSYREGSSRRWRWRGRCTAGTQRLFSTSRRRASTRWQSTRYSKPSAASRRAR